MRNCLRFKICFLILCTLAIGGCRSPFVPKTLVLQAERGVVPMRLEKNVLLVDVFINGQGPYTFGLDTGAAVTGISRELADKLDLPEAARIKHVAVTYSGRKVTAKKVVHIQTLRIGTAEFREFKATVRDYAEKNKFLGTEHDGTLGFNLFTELLQN